MIIQKVNILINCLEALQIIILQPNKSLENLIIILLHILSIDMILYLQNYNQKYKDHQLQALLQNNIHGNKQIFLVMVEPNKNDNNSSIQ